MKSLGGEAARGMVESAKAFDPAQTKPPATLAIPRHKPSIKPILDSDKF